MLLRLTWLYIDRGASKVTESQAADAPVLREVPDLAFSYVPLAAAFRGHRAHPGS